MDNQVPESVVSQLAQSPEYYQLSRFFSQGVDDSPFEFSIRRRMARKDFVELKHRIEPYLRALRFSAMKVRLYREIRGMPAIAKAFAMGW